MLTSRAIAADLRTLGVKPRQTLLVHSSLRSLGPLEGGPRTLLAGLQDAVGPDGLILVPTHTWGTVNARQPVFHEVESPSHVGHFTNIVRLHPDAERSLHPTHSVAAIGRGAAGFVAGHEACLTPCARRSPYGRLVEADGAVLLIGVDLSVCTLFHGFEEWAELPWLFDPVPEALVTVTRDGRTIHVPSLRHAERPGLERGYQDFAPLLRTTGILFDGAVGPARCLLLDARRAAELIVERMRAHPAPRDPGATMTS